MINITHNIVDETWPKNFKTRTLSNILYIHSNITHTGGFIRFDITRMSHQSTMFR